MPGNWWSQRIGSDCAWPFRSVFGRLSVPRGKASLGQDHPVVAPGGPVSLPTQRILPACRRRPVSPISSAARRLFDGARSIDRWSDFQSMGIRQGLAGSVLEQIATGRRSTAGASTSEPPGRKHARSARRPQQSTASGGGGIAFGAVARRDLGRATPTDHQDR